MKLEQQVCSLELAKRLKKLGVKRESFFIWLDGKEPYVTERGWYGCARCGAVINGIKPPKTIAQYDAYNAAELGEMIPYDWQVLRHDDCWVGYKVEAWSQRGRGPFLDVLQNSNVLADTEADARAKMLIYLLENRLFSF